MTYEVNQRHARLEQRAHARSMEGDMLADRMDLFFVQQNASSLGPGASPGAADSSGATGLRSAFSGQQLQQAQCFGAVRVESDGRIGTGDRADYWAPEGKFVLSGTHPTLRDQFGNTVAGRQLTFLFSDDRIVVDSEEGSRTLTLHRVEK
jgi:hypothetical protein